MTNFKALLASTALLSAFAMPAVALTLDPSVMVGMVVEAPATTDADTSTGPATGDGTTTNAEVKTEEAAIARTADPESAFIGDTVVDASGELIGTVEEVLVDAADGGTTLVVSVAGDGYGPVKQFTLDIGGGAVSDDQIVVSMTKMELIGILENNM